jgi:hypothetical protein
MTDFWEVVPCSLVEVDWCLWNVGLLVRNYTTLHSRKMLSSCLPLWECQISQRSCWLLPVIMRSFSSHMLLLPELQQMCITRTSWNTICTVHCIVTTSSAVKSHCATQQYLESCGQVRGWYIQTVELVGTGTSTILTEHESMWFQPLPVTATYNSGRTGNHVWQEGMFLVCHVFCWHGSLLAAKQETLLEGL